ncbi:MAG: hypothetical protein VX265_07540 [Myxococcota bacterium]|nr:hypothetical protein [Myxococcota bacterium]MEC8425270.1 hypothetical protein [Myxococcota bacterium]
MPYTLFSVALLWSCTGDTDKASTDTAGADDTGPSDSLDPDSLQPGVNVVSIDQVVEGETIERTFRLHLPADYDGSGATPLLFAFHGNGGTGEEFISPFAPPVDGGAFVGVYPAGIANSWNIGREESTADDVAFAEAILDALDGVPGIDTSRPVGVGFSNGSALTHKIALESGLFVAIVPQASQLLVDATPADAPAPVSVMQFHGTVDDSCPYDGGVGVLGHEFMPAEDSAAAWAAANGCDATPTETDIDPHLKLEWPNCDAGRRVVHYRLNGVGHAVPPDVDGGTYPQIIDFLTQARQ